jgi:transposase
MATSSSVFVGIDISKKKLDLAIYGDPSLYTFFNDAEGIPLLVSFLLEKRPALVVVEATGGFEQALVRALQAASLAVSIVLPKRIKSFARARGLLAKTDKLDAHNIAFFGFSLHPRPTPPTSPAQDSLAALVARRRQIVDMLKTERNRLHLAPLDVRSNIEAHIAWLVQTEQSINDEIQDLIQNQPEMKAKVDIVRTAKGVGPIIAFNLIAELPELGSMDRKSIAALLGVAPMNNDSGKKHGKRKAHGGRTAIRSTFYMASLVAVRFNPVLKRFYLHLLDQHKEKKVALIACMRKFITILNAMVRDNKPFQYQLALS